jgi:hypothetical protein
MPSKYPNVLDTDVASEAVRLKRRSLALKLEIFLYYIRKAPV